MADSGDTLTDIHAAVGDMLSAPDEVALSDDALDAELDAKHGAIADEVETPDVPDPETPAPVVAETVDEPDPLKDAKPFEYTVDGQAKTYDGIRVVANADGTIQGAIIQPDAIKDVQYRLQRGEYLEAQNKTLYEKARDYDRVEATTHDGTKLSGMDAIQHYATEHAKLTASVKLLAEVIEDPEKLAAIYGDPRELNLLARELSLTAQNAAASASKQFASRATELREQETHSKDRATVTTNAITGSVQHWAKEIGGLTPDDTQKAIAYFQKLGSAIVRPATTDEAKATGVKPGELVIDHQVIHEWLTDRAEMRKQATASTTAASTAAKENAARLARSVRTKATTPTKAVRQTVPADEGETWAQQKARMMAGQFSSDD